MEVRSLVLAAALTLAAVPALAHGGHGVGPGLQSELPALFAQADADGNGSLTLDEFKTFKELVAEKRTELFFKRLDSDGDGKVTLGEIQAHATQRESHEHPH